MTRAALLLVLVALSGCTTTRAVTLETPLSARIPASLLECEPRPTSGALDRQSDVARYVVELDAAGEDCRSKLGAVSDIVREEADQDPKENDHVAR